MLKANHFPRVSQPLYRKGNHSSTPTSYHMKDEDCLWVFLDSKEQENNFYFLCASEDTEEPHSWWCSFSFTTSFKHEKPQPLAEQVSALVPNRVQVSCLLILPRGMSANTNYCILNMYPFVYSLFKFLDVSSFKIQKLGGDWRPYMLIPWESQWTANKGWS